MSSVLAPVPHLQSDAPLSQRRTLAGACLAHMLHDGYTDMLYVLLPLWRAEFGLTYAGVALVRALYSGVMGGLQVPADRLAARWTPRAALVAATIIAASGYGILALPLGFGGLCLGLVIAGIGSSVQHPRASHLVAETYGGSARGPLGIYNFAGDVGKAIFPAGAALMLTLATWRPVAGIMALAGLAIAAALMVTLRDGGAGQKDTASARRGGTTSRLGFGLLLSAGACDTATRMGYLLFLPFFIKGKGGSETMVGLGLALLFVGGAFGKAVCGPIGERLGVVASVVATEAATALLIAVTIVLPLQPMLPLLFVLGIVLNGTSSVLYGTVPDLAPRGEIARAFALFYTGVIGAGALAPIAYGALADHTTQTVGALASAMTAVAVIPLILGLRWCLAARGAKL